MIKYLASIFSHSYQADTQSGGTREREAILDGNVYVTQLSHSVQVKIYW